MTRLLIAMLFFLSCACFGEGAAVEPKVVDVTDTTFGYAFQHPSDWTVKTAPKDDRDGIRFVLQSPSGSLVQALVGKLDKSISRDAVKKNPHMDKLVQQLLNFTIENVHRKASTATGAKEMIVQKKEQVPSNAGLRLFISTLHKLPGGRAIVISGLSTFPFEKPYMVSFTMNIPVSRKLASESDALTRVFNSFHMVGESPLPQ